MRRCCASRLNRRAYPSPNMQRLKKRCALRQASPNLAIRCCYRRRAPVSICSAITGIALKCSTARLKRENLEHFSARLHKERTRRQYAQYGEREVTQGKPMKNALNHHDPFNTTV